MDSNNQYQDNYRSNNDPYHTVPDSSNDFGPEENFGYSKPGKAITAMVLGISSVSLWWYPFLTSIPCLIMGIIAVNLARSAESTTDPKYGGFIKAAKITGIIGIIISAIYTVAMTIVLVASSSGQIRF
jgi:hypothetical protein